MSIEQWLVFALASLIFFMVPGPDMVMIAGWSATKGFRMGAKAAAGTVSGLILHTIATSMGLAALLTTSASAFVVVKWVGSIYLVCLGIIKLIGKQTRKQETAQKQTTNNGPYLQALCTNLLNPKVIFFFLAFLPHFIEPTANVKAQFIILGLTYALISSACYVIFIFIMVKAGQSLGKNRTAQHLARWLSGIVMIGFGIKLAMGSK